MSKCVDCGVNEAIQGGKLCEGCNLNNAAVVRILPRNLLQEVIEEMEKSLISVLDDYRKTNDPWAKGGIHQLSVFIPKLKKLL